MIRLFCGEHSCSHTCAVCRSVVLTWIFSLETCASWSDGFVMNWLQPCATCRSGVLSNLTWMQAWILYIWDYDTETCVIIFCFAVICTTATSGFCFVCFPVDVVTARPGHCQHQQYENWIYMSTDTWSVSAVIFPYWLLEFTQLLSMHAQVYTLVT